MRLGETADAWRRGRVPRDARATSKTQERECVRERETRERREREAGLAPLPLDGHFVGPTTDVMTD